MSWPSSGGLAVHAVHEAAAHALGEGVHVVGLLAVGRVQRVGTPHGCGALEPACVQVAVHAVEGVARKTHGVGRRAQEDGLATANPLAHGRVGDVAGTGGCEGSAVGSHFHGLGSDLGIRICIGPGCGGSRSGDRAHAGRRRWHVRLADVHAIGERARQAGEQAGDDDVLGGIGVFGGAGGLCVGHVRLPVHQGLAGAEAVAAVLVLVLELVLAPCRRA